MGHNRGRAPCLGGWWGRWGWCGVGLGAGFYLATVLGLGLSVSMRATLQDAAFSTPLGVLVRVTPTSSRTPNLSPNRLRTPISP